MKRIILYLIFFYGTLVSLFAQYVPGGKQKANKILSTQSGDFAVFGSVGDSAVVFGIENCSDTSPFQTFNAFVGGKSSFEDAIQDGNGDFWAIGSCTNCAGADITQKYLLSQFQSNGTFLNQQVLGTTGIDCKGTAIRLTSTGQIILGGAFGEAPALSLQDALGVNIWTQNYPFATSDTIGFVQDVFQLSTAEFAFAGWMKNINTSEQWMMVGKVDAAGTLLWRSKYANDPTFPNEARALAENSNGNIVVAGSLYTVAVQQMDACVLEVNPTTGTGFSGPYFGAGNNEVCYDIQRTGNGSWLLSIKEKLPNSTWGGDIGQVLSLNSSFIQTASNSYQFSPFNTSPQSLVSLNSNGSEFALASTLSLGTWEEMQIVRNNFGTCGDSSTYFIQANPGGGGGIIIIADDVVGVMSVPFSHCDSSNIAFDNEEDMADCLLENIVTNLESNKLEKVYLYPNPAPQFLYLKNLPEAAEISIFSLQGIPLSFQRENEKIILPKVSSGNYLIRIRVGQRSKQFWVEIH